MNDSVFEDFLSKLSISEDAKQLARWMRNQRQRSKSYSLSVSSIKMHSVFLIANQLGAGALVCGYELRSDVQEFYYEPITIPLSYVAANSKPKMVMYTPDFFVIRKAPMGFEEWKTEAELMKLTEW
jgi:hypothetical protein